MTVTRKQETPDEPETPETTDDPILETPSEPASPADPASLPPAEATLRAAEAQMDKALAAIQRSAQLQTQNLELVVSRVGQMADSQERLYKAHQDALEVLKTSAELMQEYMAALNEQTERLVAVSAALLRYSQEQAAMMASGGSQG